MKNKSENNKNIWKNSSQEKINWVERFRDIFLNQKKDKVFSIFSESNFGVHSGLTVLEYSNQEFDEYREKSKRFGINEHSRVECFDIGENFFYFSFGNKEDPAIFEAIFKWNDEEKRAMGNGYLMKVEPKIQFIKESGITKVIRRINFKPSSKKFIINKIMTKSMVENVIFSEIELEEYLGGRYYNYSYEMIEEDSKTHWEQVSIYSSEGKIKNNVLLRGVDHPLFTEDIFPIIAEDKKSFMIKQKSIPVIIFVKTEKEEFYFKYPTEKLLKFDEEIKEICITDTLSFDWIVKL